MARPTWLLRIKQGETLNKKWKLRNRATGEVVDASTIGFTTGTFIIKDHYGGTEIVTLTTDNGGVVIEYEAGSHSGYIYMSDAATAALEDWGDGVADFSLTDGVRTKTFGDGMAVLNPTAID